MINAFNWQAVISHANLRSATHGLLVPIILAGLGAGAGWRPAAAAGLWYVAPTGSNTNDCRSLATACRTIGGAVGKAASGDTIAIAAGTYVERLSILGKNLHLAGAGAAVTIIDGTGATPGPEPFVLGTNATLSLTGATLRNALLGVYIDPSGIVTLEDVVIRNNAPAGGIVNEGRLMLGNAVISGNRASGNRTDGLGGGLWNRQTGQATLTNVLIDNNQARYQGGGIMNSGALTLTNVLLSTNAVTETHDLNSGDLELGGGGVFNAGALVFADGQLGNNSAASQGGGLANVGAATLERIAVDGNRARFGAGIANYQIAASASVGRLTLTNVTISRNSATQASGGLGNVFGRASLTNVTIADNSATAGSGIYSSGSVSDDTVTRLRNTIVANSRAGGNCAVSGQSLVSLGYNLESAASCGLVGAGDLGNTDPLLAALGLNGGFGPTYALLAGSPAIDGGDGAGCPATDQRRFARPQDGDGDGLARCDIGAYERALQGGIVFLPAAWK